MTFIEPKAVTQRNWICALFDSNSHAQIIGNTITKNEILDKTTGSGGGIGFGLSSSITHASTGEERIIDPRVYHTINEAKNGLGPAPLRTKLGWLHLAHGVRNTAAGLRYTLYLFMTDLHDLTKVIYKPGGYFLAPEGEERIGDVSNVVFSNGWIADEDGAANAVGIIAKHLESRSTMEVPDGR